jgi:sec-independent protein translocase protein TatA
MFGLGAGELFIIFLIVFLLFGAKNIPEIARGLGKALSSFKKGVRDVEDEVQSTQEKFEEELNKKDG